MPKKVLIRNTNDAPAVVRNESMEGRDYLVVPMVMMVEGVHNGSEGPLYYPAEELAKTPVIWNQKPVVIYHPDEGFACSSPDTISKYKVGVIMNATFKDGKLKAEAWLEESRLNEVPEGSTVLTAIQNNNILEVSTGLLCDNDKSPGVWNEEQFAGTTSNYRPDHLAILPNETGACSVADGAGLLRNSEKGTKRPKFGKVVNRILNVLGITNEASHNDLRRNLQSLLAASLPDDKYPWIDDVFDTYFVYSSEDGTFKQSYSVDEKEVVSITGEPVPVQVKTMYEEVNSPVKNENKQEGKEMNKTELINNMIKNGPYEESDREMLEGFEVSALERLYAVNTASDGNSSTSQQVTDEEPEGTTYDNSQDATDDGAGVTNTTTTATLEEYLAAAPPEIAEALSGLITTNSADKGAIIGRITANSRCQFTKEQLMAKPVAELQMIENLMAPAVTPLFAGDGVGPVQNAAPDVPALPVETL